MVTDVHSYRVGDDVHEALKRLAEVHGSVDKGLRFMLSAGGVPESPSNTITRVNEIIQQSKSQSLDAIGPRTSDGRGKASVATWRAKRKPLLKPGQKGKG